MDFYNNPRKLTNNDIRRMLIPQEFHRTELPDIHAESLRAAVGNYIDNLRSMYANRVGLLVWGPPAAGKGAVAAVIIKEARKRYKTGIYITIQELRESLITRAMYNSNTTPMARAKEVDMLVLDGLEEEDRTEKLLTLSDLSRLIVGRARQHRLTVLTSRMSPRELVMDSKFKRFYDDIEQYMQPLQAPDPSDAKLARRDMMRTLVLGDDA